MNVLGIFGAGGLGREVLELAGCINRKNPTWDKFIFVNNGEQSADINGVQVCSYEEAKETYGDRLQTVIGIGEPAIREKVFRELREDHAKIITLIHPDVHIPETTVIGEGVVINMGNFISCNAVIQDNVYIQPHTNIGHDCILKEGCMISGFCNVAGAVHIGRYAYLGMSSCIKEKITVGDYSIVGMASAVYKDVPKEMIAMGNPARPMRKNEDRRVFK